MLKRRVTFSLEFSVNLDSVPGWGYSPKDWAKYIKENLTRDSHYNPKVKFTGFSEKKS